MDPHPLHQQHYRQHSPSPSQSHTRSTTSTHTFTASPMPMRHDHPQLDEGFSEETRSQSDSDMIYSAEGEASASSILAMLMTLPSEQRCQIVEALIPNLPSHNRHHLAATIIRTLPNADKENLGSLCERLTKFDPVYTLPNEIMLQVLSYLSPKDLLTCSNVSRVWRPRTRDEKLWRGCFAREGWVVDRTKIAAFEERERRRVGRRGSVKKERGVHMLERKGSRKRKTEEAFSEGEAVTDVASDGMEGVEANIPTGSTSAPEVARNSLIRSTSTDSAVSMDSANASHAPELQISPPIFRPDSLDNPKVSWTYLYKQRCRLERKWEKGEFKQFQLPHPRHPEEGHTECVYTIQHTPQYLVSGSRDKTIRIWDLATQRLVREPLRGHEASVLCLQFDDRPEHDIIVSGGSDSYVIVWKFSTGEILQKLTSAHQESVLNLRFDDNYIVTCSKDKLIKIWNRRALTRDDPLVPPHFVAALPPPNPDADQDLIQPYTCLGTLVGHQAAVNAVIIHNSTIVSASGDRTIKSWTLPSGRLNKTYIGHTKGIACVQFDGRRIVSGSSDNTVRIFDAENQAEVACLASHSNLVRTVQARFGDLETVTKEELEEQAAIADKGYYDALERGMVPASASRHARRNAGSSRPDKMLSTGTKVPPGGGGGRWAKIVSGSYDEMVKVWRRGREGDWEVGLKLNLKHEEGGSGSGGQQRARHHRGVVGGGNMHQQQQLMQAQAHAQQLLQQAHHQIGVANALNQQQHQNALQMVPGSSNQPTATSQVPAQQINGQNSGISATGALLAQIGGLTLPPSTSNSNNPSATNTTTTTTTSSHPAPYHQPQITPLSQQVSGSAQQQQQPHSQHPVIAAATAASAAAANAAAVATAGVPGTVGPGGQPQPQLHPHAQLPHTRHHHTNHPDSNRVFKLQFDARRIVCCSQNKVIVGWDFANGDRELELVGGWSLETA